jgi:hypothetical protein
MAPHTVYARVWNQAKCKTLYARDFRLRDGDTKITEKYLAARRAIIISMLNTFDLVGLVGIALSIGCYARVQWQSDYAKKMSYSILNFLSAALLGVSILHNWNLSSFIGMLSGW